MPSPQRSEKMRKLLSKPPHPLLLWGTPIIRLLFIIILLIVVTQTSLPTHKLP